MKKKVKIMVFVTVIICAIICLVPIPQKHERHFYATDIFSNEEAEIYVNMTHLRFLLLEDKMLGRIRVVNEELDYTYQSDDLGYLTYWGEYPSNNEDEFFHAFGILHYNITDYWDTSIGGIKHIGWEMGHSYINPEFDKIILYFAQDEKSENSQTWQWIGSTDKDDKTDLIDYFRGYINE